MVSNIKIEFCVCWIAAVNLLRARTAKYSVNFFFLQYTKRVCAPFILFMNVKICR